MFRKLMVVIICGICMVFSLPAGGVCAASDGAAEEIVSDKMIEQLFNGKKSAFGNVTAPADFDQMSYGAEIVELSQMFFTEELEFNDEEKEVLAGEQVPEVMAAFKEKLETLEEFEPAEIKKAIKAVQKETGHKGKNLYMPIRVATTGEMHGPELNDALVLLGKETVLKRIGKYVK